MKMIAFSIPDKEYELFEQWASSKGFKKPAALIKTIFYGQIPRVAPERVKKEFESLCFDSETK